MLLNLHNDAVFLVNYTRVIVAMYTKVIDRNEPIPYSVLPALRL